MVRNIIGVILGYVAFSITLFGLFSGLYMILGASGSFRDGSFDLSWSWIIASVLVFLIGGIIAAIICGLISHSSKAVFHMGVTLLVLGVLMAIMQISQDPGITVRETSDVSLIDAMNTARGPAWSYFISPIAGYFGAMIGGGLRKSRR